MSDLTHAQLVKLASRWLSNCERCGIVIAEISSAAGEIPDVIGWRVGWSTVVECKTSRSDFLRDREKYHHRNGTAMGWKRYILAPKGVLKVEEMSEGHGLIEVGDEKRLRVVKQAEPRELGIEAHRNEIRILSSALRRMKAREFITVLENEFPEIPAPSEVTS